MLDLDREVMNKFYKSKYSDADEVTKVGFFCQGNVYMNKSHSSLVEATSLDLSSYFVASFVPGFFGSLYVSRKLPTYPSPKPTICPK